MSFAAVDHALQQASTEAIGTQHPLKSSLTYQEILNQSPDPSTSLSLGTVRSGALLQPARLEPKTESYEILKTHRPRQTYFATAQLIQAIQRAAEDVRNELGGAPLQVGNLSRSQGGQIPWSSSHQAGRDADLAIYALDSNGESVPTPGLIPFGDDGKALNHELTFDAPRNWALVRSFLLNSDINVQWIFISEALKDLLLNHAHDIDEEPELIERADHILHQPTDAPPHHDHLHLRIGCPLNDRLQGCIDWGPRWPWYDWHDGPLLIRTTELQRALDDESPTIRAQALAMIFKIRSPWAPEIALFQGLNDEVTDVQDQAILILEELAPKTLAGVSAIQARLADQNLPLEHRLLLYDVLRRTSKPAAATLAMHRFQDSTLTDQERSEALRALDHQMLPELIPPILDALHPQTAPTHRHHLAALLYKISAKDDGFDWSQDPLPTQWEQIRDDWRQWLTEQHQERQAILQAFLQRRGVDEWQNLERVDELIPLLRSPAEFERYTINIILSNWTGRWAPRDWERPEDAFRSWDRWWTRNRERMLHKRPRAWQ